MRRIASGVTDQYAYFQGPGGLSTFTVYRSRNGAAWAAMTTPTVSEGDGTNAPGIYELLLDEDMSVAANNLTEQMVFYITAAGLTPVFLEIELYADIAAIKAETALIVADTAELQTDNIPGLIAALNDLSSANILTEVNTALDTAISELSVAAPAATPTIRTGLMLLYMALRNLRDTTTTTDIITNNAGATICTATVSDDAVTFRKTEYS